MRRRLERKRRAAAAVLLWERLWPEAFPVLALLGAAACLALLGLPALLPPVLHGALLLALLAALAALSWRAVGRFARPTASEIDRRLERDAGLPHRPLAALSDLPAPGSGDPELWRAHVARARRGVLALRVGAPHPGLAARDRRALRGLLVVGLVASLVIAGPDAALRLRRALLPQPGPAAPPLPTLLQAWITPPGFTGLPPILLTAATSSVSAPSGSRLTANISGGPATGTPRVAVGDAAIPAVPLDPGSWQASAPLAVGGTLLIARGGLPLGRWELTLVADVPPTVQWNGTPGSGGGRIPLLRLPWKVAHPYGVADLHAALVLRDRPQAPPLAVDLPLPGGAPHQAHGLRQVDLTANPWAGLPVRVTLLGHDTGGLAGQSDTRTLVLPQRRFQHPAARAIVAVRQMLALHPDYHAAAVIALSRLLQDRALWADDDGGLLNLGAVSALLAHTPPARDPSGAVVAEAQDRLWMLALHLEEGLPARTAEALARARKAMHAALDAARHAKLGDKPGDKPGDKQADKQAQAKLAEAQKALEQALQRHLQALQQQAQRDPQHVAPTPQQQQALAQAMQQLQQAEQQGDMDQAQQDMADLDRALDQMERERAEAEQTPAQRQRAQQRQRGRQQMSVLRDLVQREAGLLDHAQARATPPEPAADALDQPPGEQIDTPPEAARAAQAQRDTAQRLGDRAVQHALRRAVGVLMQAQADLTGDVPAPLGDADQAMHDAETALAGGQDDAASDGARRAIAALQKGGQAMSQTMARMFGRQPGQGEGDQDADQQGQGDEDGQAPGTAFGQDDAAPGQGDGRTQMDPFGRTARQGVGGGLDDGGETAVPETMEQARTKAIQDELRRRAAERTRPRTELDYIGRLLDTP